LGKLTQLKSQVGSGGLANGQRAEALQDRSFEAGRLRFDSVSADGQSIQHIGALLICSHDPAQPGRVVRSDDLNVRHHASARVRYESGDGSRVNLAEGRAGAGNHQYAKELD
jgi:hypothetical protein